MKKTGRKIAAVVLAASMVLGTAVMASAATSSSSKNYTVTVQDKKISFARSGYRPATYNMKNTDVTLQIDEDQDLLVCFTDTKNKYRGINLKGQSTLPIGGTMNSLTLTSSLSSKVDVVLLDTASIKKMTVANKGDVTIEGDVTTLNVNAAADISVEKGASVNQAKLTNDKATLSAASGSTVRRVDAENRSNVTGSGVTAKYSLDDDDDDDDSSKKKDDDDDWDDEDGRPVTLDVSYIEVSLSDFSNDRFYLEDLEDELNDAIYAYSYDKYDDEVEVRGNATFRNEDRIIKSTGEYDFSFVFKPRNSSYNTVRESITVRVTD